MTEDAPPKRCVIADDVRSSRAKVGNWLDGCGFDCVFAENGLEAWESIRNHPPDLLVTDLEMPLLCGLELLEKIRRSDNKRIGQLPVLVMTSLLDSQTLDVVRKLGGDGLLQKPLDKENTLSVILDLIAGKKCLQRFSARDSDCSPSGEGVISPTLRRLIKTVAEGKRTK
ncbi:response regulator [Stieleria sp. ICT_E10.1]|uniref:response regulator n=1 Tax=Stieleria sedimenti TaxID=2976331 RepID=UPI0021803DAF|nr:response regulator [Stieleria sedimenti]MCS7469770.1 response regulator [Stieleria sedimenti]